MLTCGPRFAAPFRSCDFDGTENAHVAFDLLIDNTRAITLRLDLLIAIFRHITSRFHSPHSLRNTCCMTSVLLHSFRTDPRRSAHFTTLARFRWHCVGFAWVLPKSEFLDDKNPNTSTTIIRIFQLPKSECSDNGNPNDGTAGRATKQQSNKATKRVLEGFATINNHRKAFQDPYLLKLVLKSEEISRCAWAGNRLRASRQECGRYARDRWSRR